jgi:hypothetical protein
VFEEGGAAALIGSDASCTFRIEVSGVSPIHARVTLESDGLRVHDTQSPRGLYVNDDRIDGSAPLRNGDILWLGKPGEPGVVMIQCRVPPQSSTSVAIMVEPEPEPTVAMPAPPPPPSFSATVSPRTGDDSGAGAFFSDEEPTLRVDPPSPTVIVQPEFEDETADFVPATSDLPDTVIAPPPSTPVPSSAATPVPTAPPTPVPSPSAPTVVARPLAAPPPAAPPPRRAAPPAAPAPRPSAPPPAARRPSAAPAAPAPGARRPAPKKGGGAGALIGLGAVVVLLGGGAATYFLFLKPGGTTPPPQKTAATAVPGKPATTTTAAPSQPTDAPVATAEPEITEDVPPPVEVVTIVNPTAVPRAAAAATLPSPRPATKTATTASATTAPAGPSKEQQAATLRGQGDAALAAGQYDAALAHYDEALRLTPQDEQATAGRTRAAGAQAASRKKFVAGVTSVRSSKAGKGQISGFDSADVKVATALDYSGRIDFEVKPERVVPGTPYTVRVSLTNDGKKGWKVSGVEASTTANGAKAAAPLNAPGKEIAPQEKVSLGEISGTWAEGTNTWSLEVIVSSNRGDTFRSQLSWR